MSLPLPLREEEDKRRSPATEPAVEPTEHAGLDAWLLAGLLRPESWSESLDVSWGAGEPVCLGGSPCTGMIHATSLGRLFFGHLWKGSMSTITQGKVSMLQHLDHHGHC